MPIYTPTTSTPLPAAVEHCRRITKRGSPTLYLGSRLLGAREQAAVWAVYATYEQGNGIAQLGNPSLAALGLQEWWQGIRAAFQGRPGGQPVSTALAWAAQAYSLSERPFEDLYQGFQMDVTGQEYGSAEDLALYCRRVAGVLGELLIPVSGQHHPDIDPEPLVQLGQAIRLTHILRDVGPDLARGRLYLPQQRLEHYGISRESLGQADLPEGYTELMGELTATARDWYQASQSVLPQLQGRARLAIATASLTYQALLDAVEQSGYDPAKSVQVSRRHRLRMVPRALHLMSARH
ncbi:phytoene/squalene synthase family protein [Deinococcus lacus]|uniref:Phytoene/squalene synthase family protein n=1 Tax=Deinococcus lacus TaxID=392561 RepID=A0ABW1YHH6_9DEIO